MARTITLHLTAAEADALVAAVYQRKQILQIELRAHTHAADMSDDPTMAKIRQEQADGSERGLLLISSVLDQLLHSRQPSVR